MIVVRPVEGGTAGGARWKGVVDILLYKVVKAPPVVGNGVVDCMRHALIANPRVSEASHDQRHMINPRAGTILSAICKPSLEFVPQM